MLDDEVEKRACVLAKRLGTLSIEYLEERAFEATGLRSEVVNGRTKQAASI